MTRYETIKSGNKESINAIFNDFIDRVLVLYGKHGKAGMKYFDVEDWLLHYEDIENLKNVDINIYYKDGSHELIKTDVYNYTIKEKISNSFNSIVLFFKMFGYYFKEGFTDLKNMLRLYKLRKL